jgi:hypothetical protein
MENNSVEGPEETQPRANNFEIPDEVQQRFETDQFKAEVEKLRKDLRDGIGEIQTPTFFDLAGLFNEFAVRLALHAAHVNPRASFRHLDRQFAFLNVWLPMWVKGEVLKEWSASAPQEFCQLLSNPKHRRTFRNKLADSIRAALQRENAGASASPPATLEVARRPLPVDATGDSTPRRGYRAEVRRWMESKELRTIPEAAKQLGISADTLKSIMTSKGKRRYGGSTLRRVLKNIGQQEP